jgi:excisionase family DNA binding protein
VTITATTGLDALLTPVGRETEPGSASPTAPILWGERLDGDVLLAPEVAQLLRMNLKTVYELAKAGELPCWRLGRHFRFSRRAIVSLLGQCKPASHRKGQ